MLLSPKLSFEVFGDPEDPQNKAILANLGEAPTAKVCVNETFQLVETVYNVVLFVSPGTYDRGRISRVSDCSLDGVSSRFCRQQRQIAAQIQSAFLKVAFRPFSEAELKDELVMARLSDSLRELKRRSKTKLQSELQKRYGKTIKPRFGSQKVVAVA